jgi:hypothetical protein
VITPSSRPAPIEVSKKVKIRSAADLRQDFNFNVVAPANLRTHGNLSANDFLTNLRHYSVIYRHTHEALDFALVRLKADVSHQLPLQVYVGWNDGTYYSPTTGYYAIEGSDAGFGNRFRPKNREYHEFGHHVMYSTYGGWTAGSDLSGMENHGGYINPSTADSYEEGFAIFYALLVSEYMGDPNPAIYSVFGSMENRYKAWSYAGKYEEFAVTGILWSLYRDVFTLEEMWDILKVNRRDFYEYYKAFHRAKPSKSKEIDSIFIAHGFFHDTNPGNKKWDVGEPLRDKNNNSRHDAGEEYVDLGTPELLGRPWQIYTPGETIGKATNYARANRSLAVTLDDAYIKAKDPLVREYKVRVEYKNPSDGKPYEYPVDAIDGLIYLSPLPEDLEAYIIVSVASPAYSSAKPYRVFSQDYTDKLINAGGKGYADIHDFAPTKIGEDKSAQGDYQGIKPQIKNTGDEIRNGNKNTNQNTCCCIPALTFLLALGSSLAHKIIIR